MKEEQEDTRKKYREALNKFLNLKGRDAIFLSLILSPLEKEILKSLYLETKDLEEIAKDVNASHKTIGDILHELELLGFVSKEGNAYTLSTKGEEYITSVYGTMLANPPTQYPEGVLKFTSPEKLLKFLHDTRLIVNKITILKVREGIGHRYVYIFKLASTRNRYVVFDDATDYSGVGSSNREFMDKLIEMIRLREENLLRLKLEVKTFDVDRDVYDLIAFTRQTKLI